MTKKKTAGAEPPRPFLGEFTIDPRTPEFRDLRSVCEKGNPWRCLIATTASIHVGRRVTVRLDHEKHTGAIGLTYGDFRYTRPMTEEEVAFAAKFDLGSSMRKPLTVRLDLDDGTWTAKPKGEGGGRKRDLKRPDRQGKPHTKSIRARQLAVIRQRYALAEEG